MRPHSAERENLQPRKCGLRLSVKLDLLLVHWPDAELHDGVKVILGKKVAVHQVNCFVHGAFAFNIQLVDELVPQKWLLVLAILVSIG